jgi:hypothetical protein
MIAFTTHDAPTRAPRPRMEHRWGERIACGTPVSLVLDAGAAHDGRMRDVSMSGAFIETSTPFPPLARVTLSVSASAAGRGAGLDIDALVVRVAPDGVGIEWCETPRGSFCTLLGCAEHCKSRTHPLCSQRDA